jgi:hypothetical protein
MAQRSSGYFAGAVMLGDLDDFIAPSQACVNPLFFAPKKPEIAAPGVLDAKATARVSLDSDLLLAASIAMYVYCFSVKSPLAPQRLHFSLCFPQALRKKARPHPQDCNKYGEGVTSGLPCLQWMRDFR